MAKKENPTRSFILRIDAATLEAVEKWAADEFRSTNGQLQWIIAEALRKSGRLKKRKAVADSISQSAASAETSDSLKASESPKASRSVSGSTNLLNEDAQL